MTIPKALSTNENRKVLLDLLLRLVIVMGLFIVALAIIIGPKWEPEVIYFDIGNHHGFTQQDAVALTPVSLGLVWFGMGLWKYRSLLRHHIRNSPETAFMSALGVGILIGIFLGTGFGTVFESMIISFAKAVFR